MKFKLTLKYGPLRADREVEAEDAADMDRKVQQADAFFGIEIPDRAWRDGKELCISWHPVPETKWLGREK